MARTPRKSLAGQAASVARKVISRRSAEPDPEPAVPATKAAAKKAPAKKAPAKKAPAKKAPAKKAAPVKNAAAKKAPAKKVAPAKKAPAKKAAASSLVVREGETAWTKSELAEVLGELHEQRAHAAEILAAQEAELSGLMRDSGDGAGQDQADVGATSFERDHEMTVLGIERDKLAQIDHALSRIDDGTYGVCESCGEGVGKMRLMAFPRATLCMTCKQREERR